MSVTGVVLSVDVERYGGTLTADTAATDLVLQVDDVVDFADEDDFAAGPQWLLIGASAPMQYVNVDDDADTVTLAAAAGAVYEAGEPVRMWDPTIGTEGGEVIGYLCWVELDEADENDQPIPVEVRHERMAYFGVDNLAGLIGARVALLPDEDDPEAWFVDQVIGRAPVLDAGAVGTPYISLYRATNLSTSGGVETDLAGWTRRAFSSGFGPWSPNVAGHVRLDRSGVYRVDAFVDWQANTTGGRVLRVYRIDWAGSRSLLKSITVAPTPSSGACTATLSEAYRFTSGEWVMITAEQFSGAALDVNGAADGHLTSLTVSWVSP